MHITVPAYVVQAFRELDVSESHTEKTFKLMLQRYPKSVKVLQAYTRFLREVKNDPWKADKYTAETQKLAEVRTLCHIAASILRAAHIISAYICSKHMFIHASPFLM
jgi:hypothetical protein